MINLLISGVIGFGADMDNARTSQILISSILLVLTTVGGVFAAACFSQRYVLLWLTLIVLPIFIGFRMGQLPSTPTARQNLALGGLPFLGGLLVALHHQSRFKKDNKKVVPTAEPRHT